VEKVPNERIVAVDEFETADCRAGQGIYRIEELVGLDGPALEDRRTLPNLGSTSGSISARDAEYADMLRAPNFHVASEGHRCAGGARIQIHWHFRRKRPSQGPRA
jgi:hypothetical protein